MPQAQYHSATPNTLSRTSVRCAVYIRVNIGASWGAESIRMQREAAQAFFQNHAPDNWTCTATYEDIGYPDSTLQRPGLQRLLRAINAGTVDCVIVYTLDRLARMEEDFGKIVVLTRLYDVKVIALYPKPFVAIATVRREGDLLASPTNPLLSSRISA